MAAIDPSTADVTGKNDGKHLELFSIVWLDDADDEKESRGTKQKLREIINHFKKFHDAQACEEYIAQRSTDERIMLIVNGRLGRVLVPSVHKLQQISSIYVYCMDREENNQWACDFNKVNS